MPGGPLSAPACPARPVQGRRAVARPTARSPEYLGRCGGRVPACEIVTAAALNASQTASSAAATSAAATVITMTTPDVIAAPADFRIDLRADDGRAFLPGKPAPTSPPTAPHCRQPSLRGTVRRTW